MIASLIRRQCNSFQCFHRPGLLPAWLVLFLLLSFFALSLCIGCRPVICRFGPWGLRCGFRVIMAAECPILNLHFGPSGSPFLSFSSSRPFFWFVRLYFFIAAKSHNKVAAKWLITWPFGLFTPDCGVMDSVTVLGYALQSERERERETVKKMKTKKKKGKWTFIAWLSRSRAFKSFGISQSRAMPWRIQSWWK